MPRASGPRTQDAGPSRPGGGPPRLDLKVIERLKLLALANALPLFALAIGIPMWLSGRITLRPEAGAGLLPVLILLGACVVLCLSCWMILPLAQWLRARPRWHYVHGSKALWLFPAVIGWGAGFLLRLAAFLSGAAALALIGVALVRLYEVWR